MLTLLNAPFDSSELVQVYQQLGHTKALDPDNPDLALKKLGICFVFDGDTDGKPALSQVQFELRRRWTGCARHGAAALRSLS